MSAVDSLRRVLELLDAAGIPHMLVGSFAGAIHGVPRATQDIDLVIDPSTEQLRHFTESLRPDEFYCDADTAYQALRSRTMFNAIDQTTIWKIDLIIRKDRPFSLEEFARRQQAELEGIEIFVATAEDTILAKLEWAKHSSSETQLRDAAGIVEMNEHLDRDYLGHWARQLGVESLLERALRDEPSS